MVAAPLSGPRSAAELHIGGWMTWGRRATTGAVGLLQVNHSGRLAKRTLPPGSVA